MTLQPYPHAEGWWVLHSPLTDEVMYLTTGQLDRIRTLIDQKDADR